MNVYFYTIPNNEVLAGFNSDNRRFIRDRGKLYRSDLAVGMQMNSFEHKIKYIVTKNRFGVTPEYDLDEIDFKMFLFDTVRNQEITESEKKKIQEESRFQNV